MAGGGSPVPLRCPSRRLHIRSARGKVAGPSQDGRRPPLEATVFRKKRGHSARRTPEDGQVVEWLLTLDGTAIQRGAHTHIKGAIQIKKKASSLFLSLLDQYPNLIHQFTGYIDKLPLLVDKADSAINEVHEYTKPTKEVETEKTVCVELPPKRRTGNFQILQDPTERLDLRCDHSIALVGPGYSIESDMPNRPRPVKAKGRGYLIIQNGHL